MVSSLSRRNHGPSYVPIEFAERLDDGQRKRLCKLLSWSNLKKWDFNIFDVLDVTNGENALLYVGWAILGSPYSQYSMAQACLNEETEEVTTDTTQILKEMEGYNFFKDDSQMPSPSEFYLNGNAAKKLFDFLREIEKDYNPDVAYHNSVHAADVLQSVHSMIQLAAEGGDDTKTLFKPTKVDVFSILVAAAVHDVGHPGMNNAFQINSKTDIAAIYKNESVLENHHIFLAFAKMLGRTEEEKSFENHEYENVDTEYNFLFDSSIEGFTSIRDKMVDSILLTDMAKHFTLVKDVEESIKNSDDQLTWIICRYMLHLADISNPAKNAPLQVIWARLILEEFFKQGDVEKKLELPVSMLCDRDTTTLPTSQKNFISFVIKPAYEILALAVPTVGEQINPIIERNLKFWTKEEAGEGEGEEKS